MCLKYGMDLVIRKAVARSVCLDQSLSGGEYIQTTFIGADPYFSFTIFGYSPCIIICRPKRRAVRYDMAMLNAAQPGIQGHPEAMIMCFIDRPYCPIKTRRGAISSQGAGFEPV